MKFQEFMMKFQETTRFWNKVSWCPLGITCISTNCIWADVDLNATWNFATFFWTISKPDDTLQTHRQRKFWRIFISCSNWNPVVILWFYFWRSQILQINLLTQCENFSEVWWVIAAMNVCSSGCVPLMLEFCGFLQTHLGKFLMECFHASSGLKPIIRGNCFILLLPWPFRTLWPYLEALSWSYLTIVSLLWQILDLIVPTEVVRQVRIYY